MELPTNFTAALRQRGLRLTPQRVAILQVVSEADRHLSPQEIFHQAQGRLPGLTEPTVYRTLDFFCEEGLLVCTHAGSGSLVYEVADTLHHHLVCRRCGASIEIDHTALEQLYASLKKQTGYALDDRHLTLFGLCPGCQGG